MAGEFAETTLGSLLAFANGRSSPERADDLPYPVYGSNGIIGHANEINADGGTIVIGRVGSYCGSLYLSKQRCWVTDNAIRATALDDNDPRFLFYLLNTLGLNNWRAGSGQPLLNQDILSRIPASVPRPAEQRAIAHILSTLDDKIELNRRMNETLEAIARAIFKSWFVDFDPSRAKAADLIRDGVLEIGDGYRAKNSELGEPGIPFIRAGDLNNGFDTSGADVLCEHSVAKARTKVSRPGDVAFTSKGTIGRFARVTEYTEPFVYSPQVCFWRSLDREKLHPAILYCWMQSDDLKSQIEAVAGQTDMAPYVSLRDQRHMEVPIFPESQQAIARQVDSFFTRQALIAKEDRVLAAIRDTVLPKLISGEIRVCKGPRWSGNH